jgi:hypothetical protein
MTGMPSSFAATPDAASYGLPHTGLLPRRLLCSARSDMQKPQLRVIFFGVCTANSYAGP